MVIPDCSLLVTTFSRHSWPLQRTATRVTSMATFVAWMTRLVKSCRVRAKISRPPDAGDVRSHLDRHLAILAELRFRSGQPRLGELEGRNDGACRSIPQFRGGRLDLQQACVGIIRAARPPHLIALAPGGLYLVSIAHDAGAAGDRQIGFVSGIDKDEADIGPGLDLMLLGAANIGHEKNQAGIAVGPCLERSRAQPAGKLRGQHAAADLFDDVPDPGDVVILAHGKTLMATV